MKIGCTVLIVYRIQTPGTSSRTRPQNSSLSLVKNPKDENEVFLIHHTAQNNGTKYKINDNIVAVFTKFLLSGKATIRLKEPAIDLCIECDTIQLKCFLNKLRLVLQGKNSSLKLMSVAASTAPQKPKTKLVIKKKENYNVCSQLPRTLETVEISNVNMSRVDLRIFKLRHLKILNLEGNSIQCIPEEMGNLQIQELCLGSNRLGLSPYQSSWKWVSGYIIQRSLLLLKLDNNKLQHIPNTIVKLRELVTLKLDNNSLEELPVGIGKLKKLKYLYISNNKLKSLPATLRSLRLSYLDFSNNEFLNLNTAFKEYKKEDFHLSVPFLRELSALATIFYRIHYGNSDIPVTLQEYLAETSECFCRNPTFTNMPEDYVQFTPRLCIVNVVNKTPDRPAIFKLHYCAYKCYLKSRTSVHTFPFF